MVVLLRAVCARHPRCRETRLSGEARMSSPSADSGGELPKTPLDPNRDVAVAITATNISPGRNCVGVFSKLETCLNTMFKKPEV